MAVHTISSQGVEERVTEQCDDCGCYEDEYCTRPEPVDLTKLKKAELIDLVNEAVAKIQQEQLHRQSTEQYRNLAITERDETFRNLVDAQNQVAQLTERVANLKAALYIAAGEAVT